MIRLEAWRGICRALFEMAQNEADYAAPAFAGTVDELEAHLAELDAVPPSL